MLKTLVHIILLSIICNLGISKLNEKNHNESKCLTFVT